MKTITEEGVNIMDMKRTMAAVVLGCMVLVMGATGSFAKDRCVQLTDMGAALAEWGGTDIDIFKKNPVCYSPSDVSKYDNFFDSSNLFTADVRLANAVLAAHDAGKTTASNGKPYADAAVPLLAMLKEGVDRNDETVRQGKELSTEVRQDFTGFRSVKVPFVSKALGQTLSNLSTDLVDAKKVIPGLQKLAAESK